MPIFEYNGRRFDVNDEDVENFIAEAPDAVSNQEFGGKKYKVKASDYKQWMTDVGSASQVVNDYGMPIRPAVSTIEDAPKAENPKAEAVKETVPVETARANREQMIEGEQVQETQPATSSLFAPNAAESMLDLGYKAEDKFATALQKKTSKDIDDKRRARYQELMNPYTTTYAKEEQRTRLNDQLQAQTNMPAVARTNMMRLSNQLNEEARPWIEADKKVWTPEEAAEFRQLVIDETWQDPYAIVPESYKAKLAKEAGKELSEDEYFVAWMGEKGKGRKQYLQNELAEYLVNPDTENARKMAEIKERAEGKARDERFQRAESMKYWNPSMGGAAIAAAEMTGDARSIASQTAKAISNAEDIVRAYKNHQDDENFFVGAFKGMKDGLSNVDNWTGVYMLGEMGIMNKIADKVEKGEELTQEENDYLDAQAYKLAVEAALADDLGWGYKSGNVTGASVPFMLQMLASPVSASSGATVNKAFAAVGKRAIDKYGGTILKKVLGSGVVQKIGTGLSRTVGQSRGMRLVGKAALRTVEAAESGLMQSVLFNSDKIAADAMRRHQGNAMVTNRANEQYGTSLVADEAEDWWKAIGKSVVAMTAENGSEYLGATLLEPASKMLGKSIGELTDGLALRKIFDAASETGAGRALYRLAKMPGNQVAGAIAGKAQWNGLFNEYLEEVVNGGVQVLIGDMEAEKWASLKHNAETMLGLAWTSGAFGIANGVSRARSYAKARKLMDQQDLIGTQAFSAEPEKWEEFKRSLEGLDYAGLEERMRQLQVAVQTATPEQRSLNRAKVSAAFNYMMGYAQMMGIEAADNTGAQQTPEQAEADEALGEGISATEEQQGNIVRDMKYSANVVAAEVGTEDVDTWLAQYGESADAQLAAVREDANLTDETKAHITDYINNKQRYEGVMAVAEQEIEARVNAAVQEFDAQVNQETGRVTEVRVKAGDEVAVMEYGENKGRVAYVIAGNPESGSVYVRYEDGTIEPVASTDILGTVSDEDAAPLREAIKESVSLQTVAEVAERMQLQEAAAEERALFSIAQEAQEGAAPIETTENEAPAVAETAEEAVAEEKSDADMLIEDESVPLEDRQAIIYNNVEDSRQALEQAQAEYDKLQESQPKGKDFRSLTEFKAAQIQWQEQMQTAQAVLAQAQAQADLWNNVSTQLTEREAQKAAEQAQAASTETLLAESGQTASIDMETARAEAQEHNATIDVKDIARQTGQKASSIKNLLDLANKMGVKINFEAYTSTKGGGNGQLTNGESMAKSRTITISKLSMAQGTAIEFIVGHELTHQVKADGIKENWEALRDAVKKVLGEEAYDALIKNTKALYAEAYSGRSQEQFEQDIEEEVIADMFGEVLLDARNVRNLLGITPSLARRVYEYLKDLLANTQMPQSIVDAVEAWQQLAEGKGENVQGEEKKHSISPTYQLSSEIDENGRPFVLNSNGTTIFGQIEPESGLTPAPILLSEGVITNPATNDGYGLVHIEARHGEQIRNAGYNSVVDFVEEVAQNYELIREGKNRQGHQTYMLQLTDKHNNTLMVELSGDGTYWNINTAGIFKTSYGRNRKEVYHRHTTEKQSTETAGVSQGVEQSGTQTPSSMSTPTSSASKDTQSVSTEQTDKEEISEKRGESNAEVTNEEVARDKRFSIANRNQEVFVSNAARAVEGIKQEKATPQQWLAMTEKNGGLKAGEDKWLGLSDWLKGMDKKSVTKQEILDFINENMIQIEEVHYADREEGDGVNSINQIRLGYTTEGLENKQEIALTVPTIEPWNQSDKIHFGDAGEGRTVAWVRFGETTDAEGKRVLVIDEIQSKRHQEGREKGYKQNVIVKGLVGNYEKVTDKLAYADVTKENGIMIGQIMRQNGKYVALDQRRQRIDFVRYNTESEALAKVEENAGSDIDPTHVPEAPFDKNWHELAMKRMLRLAAEEGFDKVAWTTGEQQAERYEIGEVVNRIESNDTVDYDSKLGVDLVKQVVLFTRDGNAITLRLTPEGIVRASSQYNGHHISDIVGKELGNRIMAEADLVLKEQDLRIGGEGMKGFYDKMLPSFMSKYTKKWGAKVEDIELPNLEKSAQTMHAVNVTPEMKKSVMEGQAMFSITPEYKQKQLDVIKQSNPAEDDYHTWIRSVDDIKSFEETLDENKDYKGEDFDPSYTWDMAEDALQSGEITVYSSKPIANGAFVTPSKMEAEAYAGDGRIYMATLPLQDIAWIDPTQGQVAKVNGDVRFSISAEEKDIVDAAKANGTYMKAPNGEPTNLNEKQWAQVRTKAFKEWFGDWENDPENASKIVDENGEPMVATHGTSKEFYEFDPNTQGKHDAGWLGSGFYFFTKNREYSQGYARGGRVMDVFLNIRDPYYASADEFYELAQYDNRAVSEEFSRNLIEEGYDGVYYDGDLNGETVAFSPTQIKSATDNVGTFDAENADIRYSIPARLQQLNKAEEFIKSSIQGKRRNKSFKITLPTVVLKEIKKVLGRDFDSHNIDANSFVHAKKEHGINGQKNNMSSIPLRDEDFALAPFIMVAPDMVQKGNMDAAGRESVRFIKNIDNGEVIVVEKEQKNSPDDMDTITMWADLSSNVLDARQRRPLSTTSETVVISSDNIAKIRKDAEEAIKKDVELLQKQQNGTPTEQNGDEKFSLRFKNGLDWDGLHDAIQEHTDYSNGAYSLLAKLEEEYGGEIIGASSGARLAIENDGLVPSSKGPGENMEYHHIAFLDKDGDEFVKAVSFVKPETVEERMGIKFSLSPIAPRGANESIMDYAHRVAEELQNQRESDALQKETLSTIADIRRQAKANEEYRRILNDKDPHTIEEAASVALAGTKLLWDDYTDGSKVLKGVKSMMGWKEGERKKMFTMFASRENGGVSLERVSEAVMQVCDEYNIPYDETDAMAEMSAVMEVLGSAEKPSDISGYIESNRLQTIKSMIEEDQHMHNEHLNAEHINRYGMSYDDYAEIMDQIGREQDESNTEDKKVIGWLYGQHENQQKRINRLKEEAERLKSEGVNTGAYQALSNELNRAKEQAKASQEQLDEALKKLKKAKGMEKRYRNAMSFIQRSNERWEEVFRRIRSAIDGKNISSIDKKTLNSLLRTTKAERLDAAVLDQLEEILIAIETKATRSRIDHLLNTKTTAVNAKGISTGKAVDPRTQKILERLRETMNMLLHHKTEDEMHLLRSENWHLRHEKPDGYFDWTEEEKHAHDETVQTKINANNDRLRELKTILREQLDNVAVETVESIDAAIGQLYERTEVDTWTESDDIMLSVLELRKQMAAYNQSARATMQIERQLDNALEKRRELNAKVREGSVTEEDRQNIQMLTAAIRGMEGVIRESNNNTLDEMITFENSLATLINEGRANLREKIEAERKRRNEFIRNAVHDVSGSSSVPQTVNTGKKDENGKLPWYKAWYANAISSFDYMLQKVATRTMGKDSWLYQQFMLGPEGVMAANDTYTQGLQQAKDILDDKAWEFFGKDYKSAMQENSKVKTVDGVEIVANPEFVAEGMPSVYIPLKLSKGQATYVCMLWKMRDGRAKLEAQGFSDDIIERLKEYAGEENLAWAEWIQEEYLPEMREKYNERYREMYNTDMAAIEHYVPIRINGSSLRQEVQLDAPVDASGLQTKNGSLIKRVANVKPIDLSVNAMELILDHVTQMEEFYAYAPVRRDLQYVLSSQAFRNMVNANSPGAFNRLKEAAKVAVRGNMPPADLNTQWESIMSNAQRGLVSANIAYRSATAIKQALSVPAFYAYSQNPGYLLALTKNIGLDYGRNIFPFLTMPFPVIGQMATRDLMKATQIDGSKTKKIMGANFRWCMENIPDFRDRVLKNSAGDIRLEEGSLGNILDKYTEIGMAHNVFVDALTVSIGLKSIYDYEMGQSRKRIADNKKKMQKDDSWTAEEINAWEKEELRKADNLAKAKAVLYCNQTQQSGNPALLAPMQVSRSFVLRSLSNYKNSKLGYVRMFLEGTRDMARALRFWDTRKAMVDEYASRIVQETGKPIEEAKKIAGSYINSQMRKAMFSAAWYGIVLNLLWEWGSKGLMGLMWGGDDDKAKAEEILGENAVEIVEMLSYTPISGIPAVDWAHELITEGRTPGIGLSFEEIGNLVRDIQRETDKNGIGWQMGLVGAKYGMKFAGVDVEIFANAMDGYYRYVEDTDNNDDKILALMLVLNSPKSNRMAVARELYKDKSPEEFERAMMIAGRYGQPVWTFGREMTKQVEADMKKWYYDANATEEQKERDAQEKLFKEQIDNIESMDDAMRLYDSTTDPKMRKRIKNKAHSLEEDEPTFGDKVRKMLAEEEEDDTESYDKISNGRDMAEDLAFKALKEALEPVYNEYKENRNNKEYWRSHKEEIDRYRELLQVESSIRHFKKRIKQDAGNPEKQQKHLEQIRKLRKKILD